MPLLPPTERRARRELLSLMLREHGLSGAILFDRTAILYYAGFAWIPTERPIALICTPESASALFVPRLEEEHASSSADVDEIITYPEYPDDPHPMARLWDVAEKMGLCRPFGADYDGYPPRFGYGGPALSELAGERPFPLMRLIDEQMMRKSPAEIACIRESVRWANLAHTLLVRYTHVGVTETEVGRRASTEATLAMADALGPDFQPQSEYYEGAVATYRGQVGRSAAMPAAMAGHITLRAGDVLVSEARAPVWGYDSELERTLILGRPTDQQGRFFEAMLKLGEIARRALRPGVPCAEVDRAVRAGYEELGLSRFWRHHTGHSIGLRYHEAPFLDIHDPTIIRPGMVFTVEPGLYVDGVGGFRHSDTLLVLEDGVEVLTYYPRDRESLTIAH